MASWTDSIQQFNPYISEVPVDAYVNVGMQKQGLYDQNVQKIQGYLDNIAGIDVVKDSHKQYLNQRLNQLQTEVNKVVGSDFSRPQLGSQIHALTGQIASDPIIQNAIVSTANFRKGQAAIEEAKKTGKGYGITNEGVFMHDANKWLSDGNAASSFTDTYKPYTDVRKKMMDAIKEVAPDVNISEMPFETDASGNLIIDQSTGKPKLDPAMVERTVKGRDPAKIISAMYSALDENDMAQLAIDGRYHYMNSSPEAMKHIVEQNTQEEGDLLAHHLNELRIQKTLNPNDADYQQAVEDQIAQTHDQLKGLTKKHINTIKQLEVDPEGFKASFYTQNILSTTANAFSGKETSNKYVENPKYKAYQEDRKIGILEQEYLLKLRELGDKEKGIIGTGAGKGKKGAKTDADGDPLVGDPVAVNADEFKAPTEYSFVDAIATKRKERDDLISGLIDNIYGKDGLIAGAQNSGREIEPMKGYFFERLNSKWKNGEEIPKELEASVKKINDLNKELDVQQNFHQTLIDKANKQFPGYDKNSMEATVTGGTVSISTLPSSPTWGQALSGLGGPLAGILGMANSQDTKKVNLDKEDIINLAIIKQNAGGLQNKEASRAASDAEQALIKKHGDALGSQLAHSVKNAPQNFLSPNAANTDISGISDQIDRATKLIKSTDYTARQQFISGELAKSGLLGKPVGFDLNTGKPEVDADTKNKVANIISTQSMSVGGDNIPDQSKLNAVLDDKKGTAFKIVYQPPTDLNPASYGLVMTGRSDLSKATLPLTKEQAEYLVGDPFDDQDISAAKTKILNNVALTGRRTTNVSGNPEDAFYNRGDFPSMKSDKYAVAGDIVQDNLNPDAYYTKIHIKDKKTDKWVTKDLPTPYTTLEAAKLFISQLNEPFVERLLQGTQNK